MSGMMSDSFSGGVRQHLFIQSYSVVDKMENVTLVAGAQLWSLHDLLRFVLCFILLTTRKFILIIDCVRST